MSSPKPPPDSLLAPILSASMSQQDDQLLQG
jgi:hypothetical protein